MRITELPSRAVRRGVRHGAAVTASVTVLLLLVASVPTASAERSRDRTGGRLGGVPSQEQVRDARNRAAEAASRVSVLQAELALANQRLETAAVQAEQAAEAYNGARWAVMVASQTLARARATARHADRQAMRQRDRLAGVVSASYQDGGDVSAVHAALGSGGPQGLMRQMLAMEGAQSSMDTQSQQFAATAALAKVFREDARSARTQKETLLDAAEGARDGATAAATAAKQAAVSIAARKTTLVAEMAALQGISVQLAERRQSALEEIERRRAAREAAAAAAAEEETRQADGKPAGGSPLADRPDQPSPPPPSAPPGPPAAPAPPPPPAPGPPAPGPPAPGPPAPAPPAPAPPAPGPPAPSTTGAASAIAFARAQLGEPYIWAAAGPDSWDCSGLTMAAWQAGGVSLPHYSVAQYDASTPISASQLRAGDLVFWGSTGSPSSIHHVALYLGDGMIIHAPRTGRPVSIDSMYYWVAPNFFGRV